MFCCGKQDLDLDNDGGDHKRVNSLKIKTPDPMRATINVNSPRPGQGTSTAPYKDDQLLPPQRENKKGKKCLVLDLDETLVHSSFKPVPDSDFTVSVEIEGQVHQVFVSKRPHVDEYLKRCGELYEVVVFTASLAKYADPVLDILDIHKVVDWRLFRESCTQHNGSYVKDMNRMGRDIRTIMIVDNSPHSYQFNPESAYPCESWFSDRTDHELLDSIPILEQLAHPSVVDLRQKLKEMGINGVEILRREYAGRQYGVDNGDEDTGTYTGTSEDVSGTGSGSDSTSSDN